MAGDGTVGSMVGVGCRWDGGSGLGLVVDPFRSGSDVVDQRQQPMDAQ